ncbi:uncharacterized protein LOC119078121 isoform X2 [Bradysia coprophila]|uniref:uncharacterized protein LOC119078121 isoform X2 n=1 Tax=Bradysia coprophila TaxID=38358 RepID=UPI00187D6F54|nr:uncharacterized protein LOC119078121 isoform X2 [Bradysia coprophila]
MCMAMCKVGCECAPGYVRNEEDNTCCLESECPVTEEVCPLNEEYDECGSACPLTCNNYKSPPDMCTDNCIKGCRCQDGYVRNEADNTCCLESECPATETEHVCPLNEVYNECGSSCPATCNNYKNPPTMCNMMCNVGCECAPGYVRNEADNTCCLESECPATNKKRIANMTASTHLVRRAIHRICPLPIEVNDEPDTLASSSQHIQNPAQPSVIEESKETTEQSPEIEVANAETTIEEVSAIAKPQGKLLRVSNGREPPVIVKQPDEPIARRTRSKIKTTICSVATVAFVFLAFLGRAKAEQCQYKSFDHNPGLYFEPVGRMALTHDKWNIICVLSLDQLWSQASEITTMLDQLDTICSKIKPPKLCNITRKQFRQQVKILEEQSELIRQFSHQRRMRKRRAGSNSDIQLSLSEKVNKRSKRGWVNIFGSALKLTTGVMDHDDSELIQKQVEYLNGTYQNAMKLIADQTTIQDITQNIIKRDEVNVSKQYTIVHNEVLELRNVTIENSHFDSLSIQALSLIENHRERINAIIDVITQVRHGHISTILITPQQLMQHLEKMSGEIKRNLMIPGNDVQTNLVHLYSIMNAEVSMGKRNLIIKLTIPLIEREFYDMHHIIPVPFRNDKNAMRIIHTTAQYICINNRQDKYYMISHNENAACKAFVDNIIICEQKHMLYNIYNGSAECEMAIFTHTTKAISPRCALIPVLGDQIWSKLHTPNTFLFTTKTRTTFNIICGNKATTCYAEGAGIVQLDPQCVLQAANYEITSENDVDYGELHIVIPKLNISDILIEIKPNSSNEPTHETMQLDEQMAILEKAIHNQKQQMQTFPTISVHDIHHYTMVYVIVILLIVFISLFIYWMLKVRKQQSFTIETVPVTNIEKIPKDESLNVTFSA